MVLLDKLFESVEIEFINLARNARSNARTLASTGMTEPRFGTERAKRVCSERRKVAAELFVIALKKRGIALYSLESRIKRRKLPSVCVYKTRAFACHREATVGIGPELRYGSTGGFCEKGSEKADR